MNWKYFSVRHKGRIITGLYDPSLGTISEIKQWLQMKMEKT